MKIFAKKTRVIEEEITLQYPIEFSGGESVLWYRFDKKYQSFITDFLDGPLIALLFTAMGNGEDIYINGTISERLYYNISRPMQMLLKKVFPFLKLIKIYPEEINSHHERANGVATGFSCGVDSFCLLKDHYISDVPIGFKITHLLFNNVGSHGRGNDLLFKNRYKKNKIIADRMGLPLIKIDSNLDSFYNMLSFQKNHTLRNPSIPLLLQNGIGRFYYASGYDYSNISLKENKTLAYIDPIILPMLSTEVVDMISSGSEYTRVEKTIHIADLEITHDSIDVCTNPSEAGNCSVCWKCMRTLLTLDITGLLDLYTKAFDLQKYYSERYDYFGKILVSKDIYSKEIIKLSKEMHYPIPFNRVLFSAIAHYIRVQNNSHPRFRSFLACLQEKFYGMMSYFKGVYRKLKKS